MPIYTTHSLYDANAPRWKRCRDAYDGEDAIKAAGVLYLPKIDPSQTDAEYQAYKKRAPYYEAVSRTVDGFVGAISRKPHVLTMPKALESLDEDATADGVTLVDFIKKLCCETLLMARGAIVVDMDDLTQRPYLAYYPAEAILNWGDQWVTLAETIYTQNEKDPFLCQPDVRIRHLFIENGQYHVEIWQNQPGVNGTKSWQVVQETTPTRRAEPLTKLPFFWVSTGGNSSSIAKPPLLGLVNASLSHYRSAADLEHGRHFTALPTLFLSGVENDDEPVCVGAGAVIKLADPAAKAGYAEFSGQGLLSLENAITTKEQQMAMLGASMIAAGPKGVEAAETTRIRTAGENAMLLGVVSAVEQALLTALNFAAYWLATNEKCTIRLNRDFIDQPLDAESISGLLEAVLDKKLALEDFLFALQQAELIRPTTNINEEAKRLKNQS